MTAALLVMLSCPSRADGGFQLITNGDFESGLAGWSTAIQPGSNGGWYSQSGTSDPNGGFTVQPPPGPTHAAMSDGSLGSQVLYQDFFVPAGGVTSATLSFDRFVANQTNNQVVPFSTVDSLDYTIVGNRQARVDILSAGADPFGVSTNDVLLNLFRTQPSDPRFSGYTTQSADLTALLNAHAGQTLRLRFAEVSNPGPSSVRPAGPVNFGVDRVSLDVSNLVPEPTSLALMTVGGIGVLIYAWRTRDVGAASGPASPSKPASSPESEP